MVNNEYFLYIHDICTLYAEIIHKIVNIRLFIFQEGFLPPEKVILPKNQKIKTK